ncbi:uncharacterized protein LOC141584335 [Saimiri boliviensis]|uniref:uncharacterized protein LOC141584335 n=1 Tax=Saimiri boliviensis TaxID=27679 RepID=UPI003D77655B
MLTWQPRSAPPSSLLPPHPRVVVRGRRPGRAGSGSEARFCRLISAVGLLAGCTHICEENLADSEPPVPLVVRGGFTVTHCTHRDGRRCAPRLHSLQAVPEDQRARPAPTSGAAVSSGHKRSHESGSEGGADTSEPHGTPERPAPTARKAASTPPPPCPRPFRSPPSSKGPTSPRPHRRKRTPGSRPAGPSTLSGSRSPGKPGEEHPSGRETPSARTHWRACSVCAAARSRKLPAAAAAAAAAVAETGGWEGTHRLAGGSAGTG